MERRTTRTLGILERMEIVGRVQADTLPCGCRIGRYVTLSRALLTLLDEPAEACRDRTHQIDLVIAEDRNDADSGEAA